MWRRSACTAVLPLAAVELPDDGTWRRLALDRMACRVTIHVEGEHRHVLFAQEGRTLQLEVSGPEKLETAALVTPALPACTLASGRLLAVKRLSDVIASGQLRASLYPRERRAPRLIRVVRALDGWQAGVPHRDIAVALFGQQRVERDWNHPGRHLRDQVRRAIAYGRDLMNGGYTRFLG